MLALPLLILAFEEDMIVNGYTFPIVPKELEIARKEHWIAAGKSPAHNPIENISLAVQQLGDQLAIVPLVDP